MPTPPNPFSVLTAEKKSHRTKKELQQRQQGEAALSTGIALRERPEVKKNPVAHREFKRIIDLLCAIGKNDAIYETIINRYCMILAECQELEQRRGDLYGLIIDLKKTFDEAADDIEASERAGLLLAFVKGMSKLSSNANNIDKTIQAKRKMLFDIERENIMTIAAASRSIPKKEERASNPLMEALKNG